MRKSFKNSSYNFGSDQTSFLKLLELKLLVNCFIISFVVHVRIYITCVDNTLGRVTYCTAQHKLYTIIFHN